MFCEKNCLVLHSMNKSEIYQYQSQWSVHSLDNLVNCNCFMSQNDKAYKLANMSWSWSNHYSLIRSNLDTIHYKYQTIALFTTKIKPWHYSLLRSNIDIIHY